MLGDCVRCAVIPGYGGSSNGAGNTDSGGNQGQEGGSQNEGGTFGDGGMTDGPTDGPLFDTGGSVFDGPF